MIGLVDTNVLISAAFPIEGHADAVAYLRQVDQVWAPELWRVEFAHVASRQVRLGKLAHEAALTAAGYLAQLVTREYPTPPLQDILAISNDLTVSGQDAIFLYWAQRLGQPLITRDKRLVRAAGGLAEPLPTSSSR